MQFDGTFELEETTQEEVWLALSDPVLVRNALPGCEFLVEVEDEDPDFDELREQAADRDWETSMDPDVVAERSFEEGGHYAALMEISVGSVSPSFETVVTIAEREFPDMLAEGQGESGNSSFEMQSGMHLAETDDGVGVEWETEADVFGRIAQMGQRVINPVANRVVKRFFQRVQDQVEAMGEEEPPTEAEAADAEAGSSGFSGRIRDRMGI
jgi:carbon monoxide dehydrogenase subunit G